MTDYSAKDCEVAPYFDLELLMSVSQETRIDHEAMEALSDAWDRWLPHARARHIETPKGGYLLAWLDESVEDDVDDMWEERPSEAFLFNALAQVMCMGIVHSLLPEVEAAGCAPAPRPTDELADALEAEGVPYLVMGEPGLARRFAVVTPYPFRGGCELCVLRKDCPKAGGGKDHSVTLPGYER
jgi:hypothetical protein